MEIIDVHAHIFPAVASINKGQPLRGTEYGRAKIGNETVQFLPPSFRDTTCSVETMVAYMDWCGISRALLMANPYYGYFNDYFIESLQKYPDRFRAVSLVDVTRGAAAARELEQLYESSPLFGLKIECVTAFQCAPHMRLNDETLRPVWEVMDRCRQPLFIHMLTDEDVQDVAELIGRYHNMRFILCHMGADACHGPNRRRDNFDTCIALVRDHENVWFDTSSVSVYFEEEYPWPSTVAVVQKGWREAGARKLLWGSDFPGMLTRATMKQLIQVVARECRDIPESDRALILGGNARELFFAD